MIPYSLFSRPRGDIDRLWRVRKSLFVADAVERIFGTRCVRAGAPAKVLANPSIGHLGPGTRADAVLRRSRMNRTFFERCERLTVRQRLLPDLVLTNGEVKIACGGAAQSAATMRTGMPSLARASTSEPASADDHIT
jgi:predicted amidohydrolase